MALNYRVLGVWFSGAWLSFSSASAGLNWRQNGRQGRSDGPTLADPMALASGTSLGPYQIEAPLGAGGMGEVYKARDTRLVSCLAVKVQPERCR